MLDTGVFGVVKLYESKLVTLSNCGKIILFSPSLMPTLKDLQPTRERWCPKDRIVFHLHMYY